jgi:hypothetical protein
MSCAKDARRLAEYIVSLPEANKVYHPANKFSYYHIGALFTDVVLQAGLNYDSVVKPRVQRVILTYPEYDTVTKFHLLVNREGLSTVINWKHEIKLDRFRRLMEFALSNNIDTCSDLKYFLCKRDTCEVFLSLNGFGPKSLDYLLKLLNVDTIAVDRHIYSFVKMANIEIKGYHETKKIVEYAADFLNIPRSAVDYIIWNFMSKKEYLPSNGNSQFLIEFPDKS